MLEELLKQREERIRGRWLDAALAAYSPEARVAWTRERNRFANPVGHSLRVGLEAILGAVLDGEADGLRDGLDEIMRIRAVQRMSPREAVGFVFTLKEVIRDELVDVARADGGTRRRDPPSAAELARVDDRIDRVALAAFDLYVDHRERLSELRIRELKRNIPWAATRAAGRDGPSPPRGPATPEEVAATIGSAGEETR
ncbi:MAG: RsbRD N-terminal domain-containing protein [Gemmatimonadota bacterium]|jgi:hypothetical protein